VSAAGGGFQPGKNIGDPSLYLWASITLGGTGAHSDRVALLLAAEAMFGEILWLFLSWPYVKITSDSLIFGEAIFLILFLIFRGKTQPQPFCTDAYFDKKTLSAPPQPLYRWKAEIFSFLHVLLVVG
jgi:hypothetical protein